MKRKAFAVADKLETQQSGRRQPTTSCFNCRVKKIKCDRGAPCASCVVRGISCTGQPESEPADIPQSNVADPGADASILSRLAILERAVFGDARHGHPSNGGRSAIGMMQPSPATSSQTTGVDTPSPSSYKDAERQQTAKFLDLTYTRDVHSVS
ncbi:hypothetical protein F4782DRAFT_322287 [Xylaria castorea]|nr:hypothetical protein F4782DRAFT_322287 [Xylaria castorea]